MAANPVTTKTARRSASRSPDCAALPSARRTSAVAAGRPTVKMIGFAALKLSKPVNFTWHQTVPWGLWHGFGLNLRVGDGETRAEGERGELIDGIAAGAPIRKLFLVEA